MDSVAADPRVLLLIETKIGERAHPVDVRSLADVLASLRPAAGPLRGGLIVTMGREARQLAPGIWEVPFWLLFGGRLAS